MQFEATAQPILDEDFDSEDQLVPHASRPARPAAWRVAAVAAAMVAGVVLVAWGTDTSPATMTRVPARPDFTELDEHSADPCGKMPFLRLVSVKSNNLGGKGPETDKEEGIAYEVIAHNTGLNNTNDLQIHMHAKSPDYFGTGATEGTNVTGPYRPEWAKHNGITGGFGTINIHPGTNVTVAIHAYDATEKKDIHLPKFAMTFFDLDTGKDGNHSVEYLKINHFSKYFVTNETELEIREEEDGATKFTASVEGNGDDNPDTPLKLTPLQKNRAVSFVFDDQKEVVFQVGASPGDAARVFQFIVRPIMRCAYTKLPDGTLLAADDPNSPISLVQGSGEHTRCSALMVLALALLTVQRWL